jgi:hypothetical protein
MLGGCVRVEIQLTLCTRQSNCDHVNHPPLYWDDPIRRDLRLLRFTVGDTVISMCLLKIEIYRTGLIIYKLAVNT